MANTLQSLRDAIIRHAVLVDGLTQGQEAAFASRARQMAAELRRLLADLEVENVGELSRADLREFLASVNSVAQGLFAGHSAEFRDWLDRFAFESAQFEVRLYQDIAGAEPSRDFLTPAAAAGLVAAYLRRPSPGTGELPEGMLRRADLASRANLTNAVRRAYAERATINDLRSAVFGAGQAQGFRGGVVAGIIRAGSAAIDTAIHGLNAFREETIGAATFRQYQWISVLDDRTTEICQSRNGNIYTYGEGPVPPAHYNCRSEIMPVPPGMAPGGFDPNENFADWFKRQPRDVQEELFGFNRPGRSPGDVPPEHRGPLTLQRYRNSYYLLTGE